MIVSTLSALGTALSAGTFLSSLGTFALKAVVGLGLNAAAMEIAGKPQKPVYSVQVDMRSAGDIPRSIMLGRSMTAGTEVYANVFGSTGKAKNAYLVQVIALSDVPVDGLEEFWVNGKKCTILYDDEEPKGFTVQEFKKDGDKDLLFIRFYDGTQTVADPFLVATLGSHPTLPYQSTRVGRGVAYAVVIARTDEDWGGVPEYKFVLRGAKLYDPSRDSSVGGVGAQRWADRSTWGGDGDNLPAVQVYNILRGISYNGEWLYGLQNLHASRLPAANWINAINKCRLQVANSSGGTEPQYRSGGEIMVNVPPGEGFGQFMTACHGELAESGGVYKIAVGAPDAPLATIDDGTIISTEEQSFTPFLGIADTINGVAGKFPNPAEAWNMRDAPALYRPDLEALDGGERLLANPNFDLVPYPDQVQRLQKSTLEDARKERRHTLVLPPQFWALEPTDTFAWTSVRYGYAAKWFRVKGAVDRQDCNVLVDIVEVDPADFSPPATYQPIVAGPTVIVLPEPQAVESFDVEGVDVASIDGRKRPGIRLTWNGQDQDDVVAVAYEIQLAGGLVVVERSQTPNVVAGEVIAAPGSLMALTNYEVRAKFIPGGERRTLWTDWTPVMTTNARYNADDFLDAALGWNKLAPEVQQFQTDTEDALAAVLAGLDGKAPAAAVTALETRVTTVEGVTTAQASAITAVQAQYQDVSASSTFRATASAGPDGYAARIALQARTGTPAAWKTAGIYIDVPNGSGPSRVVVAADQFLVTDGAVAASPFEFSGGTLRVKEALISRLTGTLIRDAADRLRLEMDVPRIIMNDGL